MYFNNSLCGFWFGLTWFSFSFFLDDTIICLMVVEWLFQKYLFPPGQQSSWQRGDSRGSWSISHHIWSLLVWPKILICIVKVSTTLVCLSICILDFFYMPFPPLLLSQRVWHFGASEGVPHLLFGFHYWLDKAMTSQGCRSATCLWAWRCMAVRDLQLKNAKTQSF